MKFFPFLLSSPFVFLHFLSYFSCFPPFLLLSSIVFSSLQQLPPLHYRRRSAPSLFCHCSTEPIHPSTFTAPLLVFSDKIFQNRIYKHQVTPPSHVPHHQAPWSLRFLLQPSASPSSQRSSAYVPEPKSGSHLRTRDLNAPKPSRRSSAQPFSHMPSTLLAFNGVVLLRKSRVHSFLTVFATSDTPLQPLRARE
jgi:hypothetical protein